MQISWTTFLIKR